MALCDETMKVGKEVVKIMIFINLVTSAACLKKACQKCLQNCDSGI